MSVGTIDEKWRITIPKEARKSIRLFPRMPVDMKLKKGSLVIMPLRKSIDVRRGDSLTWLLKHPIHVEPKKLRDLKLDSMEDEMW